MTFGNYGIHTHRERIWHLLTMDTYAIEGEDMAFGNYGIHTLWDTYSMGRGYGIW